VKTPSPWQAIWILAKKDLSLLVRDRRAALLLLVMPLIFILVLGMALGESFGQKPDDRLRITLVDEDKGFLDPVAARVEAVATLISLPLPVIGGDASCLGAVAMARMAEEAQFPFESWSRVVLRDLAETAEIRVELLPNLQTARQLSSESKRSAIIVFGPNFSRQVHACSFLTTGINPFYRDGVRLEMLDAQVIRDPTQSAAASIIEQVAQVSMLRVILPWMIGRAFEKLSDPSFLSVLASEAKIPRFLLTDEFKAQMGSGIKVALKKLFAKYNLTGKTWAALTKSDPRFGGGDVTSWQSESAGLVQRGAVRYQVLVPSYTVMFAFFLVLTLGWMFVAERRQGTLKRLLVAPLNKSTLLVGKLIPCFLLSAFQGLFLLVMGNLVFGMHWGAQPLWLVPLVVCTSTAATGLAMLIATLARTEGQVAIFGTLLVLVLAGISGCLMPRELMPEAMKQFSLITPQAWALEGYAQLLLNPQPNLHLVEQACGVLLAFGLGFLLLSRLFFRGE
jgi:ABC-2 type transport system permease protein